MLLEQVAMSLDIAPEQLERKLLNRFGFHRERRHLGETFYRYDNFPNTTWRDVDTYPRHFHRGSRDNVESAPFAAGILAGFRDSMRFVEAQPGR